MTLIFCDFDGTLFQGNVSTLFGKFLMKKKIIRKRDYAKLAWYYCLFSLKLYSLKNLHKKAFELFFKGKSSVLIKEEANLFFKECKEKLYPFTLNFLKQSAKNKDFIALCSSSPSFLVSLWKDLFPVDAIFATEYEEDREGRYSDISLLIDGEKKRELFLNLKKKYLNLYTHSVALSDSLEDFPILQEADKVLLINPSFLLKIVAKCKNWKSIACELDY